MPKHIDFTTQPPAVRLAAHCIGLDHKRPSIRHGKRFYKPYRNYYISHPMAAYNNVWHEYLIPNGYAITSSITAADRLKGCHCNYRYKMTRKGLDWLGEQLGITIYDEED